MPTQLDFCKFCNAPIYAEECDGGCSCLDGRLRGLLAMRIAKSSGRKVASTAPVLPDLTPEMVLSGAGLAEYRAMTTTAQAPQRQMLGRSSEQRGRPVSSFDRPLESLWLNDEQIGSLGGEFMSETVEHSVSSDDFDIQFDADDPLDYPRATPNRDARFRVDRAPSLPATPLGPRVSNIVVDGGETVGNRRVMRDTARSIRDVRAEARAPMEKAPAQPSRPTPPVRTFYERLVKR